MADTSSSEENAKEAHRGMSNQELQEHYEKTREQVEKGSEYHEKEEQWIREEMARRGMPPRTKPNA